MASGVILPVPKALYLCEAYIGYPATGVTDLMNIFNALRPDSYPFTQQDFVVYSRLSGGLGTAQLFIEIHDTYSGDLLGISNTFPLNFPRRTITVELAITFQSITFANPGVYTIELYIENQFSCDCTLELL